MKQKPKKPEAPNNWMDTYGDMVTLLLCFFVLLYSMSTVDQVKWENLVRSLNPDADVTSQIVIQDQITPGEDEVPGTNEADTDTVFEELHTNLLDFASQNADVTDIEVAMGDGYQFIRFTNSIFFDGDSSVLRPEGAAILDEFNGFVEEAAPAIKELQVLGHTTQADPNEPNVISIDRVLSASRSAVVVAYIQEGTTIEPSKLVSSGYGQFQPIAPFDTEENRAKNRRVEILITKTGSVEMTLDKYYEDMETVDVPPQTEATN